MARNILLAAVPADADALAAIVAIREAASPLSVADLVASLGYTSRKVRSTVAIEDADGNLVCALTVRESRSWAFNTAVSAAHEAWIAANPSPFAEAEIEVEAPAAPAEVQFSLF